MAPGARGTLALRRINHGANPTIEDEMSLRPANLAARSGRRGSRDLLISVGGPPSPELGERRGSSDSFRKDKDTPPGGSPDETRRVRQTLAQLQAEHARKKAEDAAGGNGHAALADVSVYSRA